MLEKNTAGGVKEKKQYVMRMLKDKDPEYITENFDYVVKMFDKDEDAQRELVTEAATKATKTIREKVDTPARKETLTESAAPAPEGEGVGGYLNAMKRQDRFSTKS